MHSLMRRAWVDVDLGALLRNGTTLATHANVPLLPMVKADAYGLGAERVARTLERLDPWGFGVATIAEGEELRAIAITRPIVIFTPLLARRLRRRAFARISRRRSSDAAAITRWTETGRPWQLAIDTGMSRAGIQWNEVDCLRDALAANPPQGAFTHFHSAEKDDATRRSRRSASRRRSRSCPIASGDDSRREQPGDRTPRTVAVDRRATRHLSLRRRQRQLAGDHAGAGRLAARANRRPPNGSRRRDGELRRNVSRRRRSPDRDAWHWLRRRLSPRAQQSRLACSSPARACRSSGT